MALNYIFDIILGAGEFDTISRGHRGLHQRSDLAKMNELFDPKRQDILYLSPYLISLDTISKEKNEYVVSHETETQL